MLTTVGNWHKQENINFPPSRSLQSFVFVQYDMQDVIEQQMLMTNANSANHWALEMIENELTPPLNQNKFNMNTTLNILIHNKDIFPACTHARFCVNTLNCAAGLVNSTESTTLHRDGHSYTTTYSFG